MRFAAVFTALTVAATAGLQQVSAQSFNVSSDSIVDALLLQAPHYNAPNPPWVAGATPGWYYGKGSPDGILCILEGLLCELLELLPFCLHCPHKVKNPPEYTPTFTNLTCAAQDSSYQTYGLVDTVADCQSMCDTVEGCVFFNVYHDNNADDKNDSPLLTCALFTSCLGPSSADNCGGQTQSNGLPDTISESSGFCKKTPTA
ncbi:hypothetical protein HMN09_00233800 [Mycena chlorophos]|uniref:Fruit-body specific protein a n=1 Tax=Mycena chlorophos TaxID=658473 RepID=A0A8H6WLD5_MYCCL|nr:hypothetical protein HMN09_00233800 [Mycena chlorophos]